MLENAVYSVISPRGFASILWKDGSREKEAAGLLKMTAKDLLEMGVADYIIPEPRGGAQNNLKLTAELMSGYIESALKRLQGTESKALLQRRYEKFRKVGIFAE